MHRDIKIDLLEPGPQGAVMVVPRPIQFWDQTWTEFDAGGLSFDETSALNAPQEAFILKGKDAAPSIRYSFEVSPGEGADDQIWLCPKNRLTTAHPDLSALAEELCPTEGATSERLSGLVNRAAEIFDYDHPEQRFNDGHDNVPTLCGTTKGSCVEINTFVLAGALSQGITGQYFMGYWFGPERNTTPDAHCWLGFEEDGAPLFWDIAHHLKWGVSPLAPGLNPAGGRRIAFSAGRGLEFETENGPVTISHFSEPVWVLPDGSSQAPEIRISLEERE
ncbi:MAG: transglutaminase-like domain-containing protein [Pseudomonadota bacterium]